MATEVAPPDAALPKARFGRRALWRRLRRLSAWGCGAAVGLAALAITSQTQDGSERIQSVVARVSNPAQTGNDLVEWIIALVTPPEREVAVADVPTHVTGINPETVRLEAQLRVLTADRDRLMARIANLERSLDDMTGSIKKQVALAAETAAKTPVPVPAPVAAQAPAPPIIAPLAMPAATETATPWSSDNAVAQAAAPVPLPPVRVAATAAADPEAPRKPEIGIDLGGAQNMDVLGARWTAVKANFGPLLTGFRPLAAHDPRPGITNFRLVVGPLPTNAAAAQLCARFAASGVTCRPTKFDGERIAQH